jgi:hypothetical protein
MSGEIAVERIWAKTKAMVMEVDIDKLIDCA